MFTEQKKILINVSIAVGRKRGRGCILDRL